MLRWGSKSTSQARKAMSSPQRAPQRWVRRMANAQVCLPAATSSSKRAPHWTSLGSGHEAGGLTLVFGPGRSTAPPHMAFGEGHGGGRVEPHISWWRHFSTG